MTYDSVAAPRDNLGRIMRRSETVLGTARVLDYSYDERGRLIGVAEGATVLSDYDYDDNGNRLSLTTPTDIFNGAYDDQDRLLSYGDLDYTYGENGEVETKTDTVSSDTTTYVYDALGSLLSVELPDTTLIEYVIDGQKRRVGKKVDGVMVQSFLYKDQLRIAAELNGAGAIVSHFSYVGASHSPDYMTKGGALYRFVKDQVGSPRLIVNALTGAIAQELEYDEFGLVTTDTNPGFQPFGFAGGLYDGDTGLTRFGARDYDAVTGRWTSKDPIRWEGGQGNLYLYVGADPLNHIDADGHFLIDLVRSLYHGLLCAYYQTRFADAIEDCREEFDRACEDPICDECLELGGDMGASRFNCLMSKDPAASEGLILHCGGLAGGFAVQRGTIRRGQ